MIKKTIAPALAVFVLAGTVSAYAATATNDHGEAARARYDDLVQCENLAAKFDKSVTKHENAKNLARAKELRAQGMNACTDDNFMYGIHSLEQALLDIGVTPPSVNYF